MSRLIKNTNHKYPLIDNATGEIVEFGFSVDANEALQAKNEKGEHRYSLPELKSDPLLAPAKGPKIAKDPITDVGAMQAEQANEFDAVKVIRKTGKKGKAE